MYPMQVVMTLGPATAAPALIESLMDTAARFRLNAAHLPGDELRSWLERLDAIYQRRGESRPVVIDLQGAKMRVGRLTRERRLAGEVTLVCAGEDPGIEAEVPVPHPELFQVCQPGERLTLDDARITLEVAEVSGQRIRARVLAGEVLRSSKGINRMEHPVPFQGLAAADLKALELARPHPFCQFAFSFVLDGSEAARLRGETDAHLVAKLERPEALDHVPAIDAAFDELWLCRGDLGSQAGLGALGSLQHDFARRIPELDKPALLAGQVLEHMTHHPEPTRSEVVHLHDTARLGWAGVVLSDETAVGAHPGAVRNLLRGLPFISTP